MNSNKNASKPIGIFDSGIGGLTAAAAICKQLPNENIIYFGDTAHLPYGDKSPAAIRHYAARISNFLIQQQCKSIVIACNTASAHAFQTVKDVAGNQTPVINVVDPAVNFLAEHYSGQKVGIIGTKGTVNSRTYVKKLEKAEPTIKVSQLATPLLAPMIEEGFFNNKISQTIINSYLEKNTLKGISALVMACTHYPLIKREIEHFYRGKVAVIDTSDLICESLIESLKTFGLLNQEKKSGNKAFFVSDYTKAFEESARIFFGERIKLSEKNLWK